MKTTLLLFLTLFFTCIGTYAQVTKQNKKNLRSTIIGQRQISLDRNINSTAFKPCRKIESNWDTTANIWNFQDSVRYTYNSSGNITSELSYYVGITYPNKKIYIYNSNGKETSDTSMYWDGSAYVINQLTTFTYDTYGNLTEQLYYSNWNGNNWGNGYKDNYTYDVNNNQTQDLSQYWDGSVWFDSYKADYTWISGQMTEEIDQNWDGTNWIFSSKYNFTYANDQMNSFTTYTWNGSTWENEEKYVNVVWYQWDGWFSNNSLLTSLTQQVPNGNLWNDTMLISITYDGFGNQTDYKEQFFTSTIINYEQKDIYQYNGNNTLTEDIEQHWVNATIGLRNSYKRDYSDFFQYTDINEIYKKDNVTLYPNPFSTRTTISFENEVINITIKIVDVLGREVKIIDFSGSELTIERAEMNAGIYFLQIIEGKKNVINKKIIIQ